jgi:hypothetical protein
VLSCLPATSVQTLHSLVATVEQLLEANRKAIKGKGKEPAPAGSTTDDVEMTDELGAAREPETRRTVIECKSGTSLETLIESIVLGLLGDDPATGSVRSPSRRLARSTSSPELS